MSLLLWGLALAAGPVDLNRATATELDALPGIGLEKAEAIIAHRERHGRFTEFDDVSRVSGIGPGVLAVLRSQAVLGPEMVPIERTEAAPDEADRLFVPSAAPLDPNTATLEDWMAIPGIPEARARAILTDREQKGPFESCQDLARVEGIGRATVARVTPLCAQRNPR